MVWRRSGRLVMSIDTAGCSEISSGAATISPTSAPLDLARILVSEYVTMADDAMAPIPIVLRVPPPLLAAIDAYVEEMSTKAGRLTRTAVMLHGLETFLHERKRRR